MTSTVSRLVIDLNRSIGHPQLWSAATRGAPRSCATSIVERHYRPYRAEVERLVRRSLSRGRRVIHVSSHSFTPVLDGKMRRADVGLLYDPRRRGEAELVRRWKASLALIAPAAPRAPQLSLCRQGRRPDFGAARRASRPAPTSGSSSRSTSGSSSPRAGAGRRCAAR